MWPSSHITRDDKQQTAQSQKVEGEGRTQSFMRDSVKKRWAKKQGVSSSLLQQQAPIHNKCEKADCQCFHCASPPRGRAHRGSRAAAEEERDAVALQRNHSGYGPAKGL